MRDAFGGIVNIVIIVVFLVIVSGYLAFNVNYTKAFRVKNKIISTYEQYEGVCLNQSNQCHLIIKDYMKQLGYDAPKIPEEDGYTCPYGWGYCYKEMKVPSTDGIDGMDDTAYRKVYYKIKTRININIPIINNIMPSLRIFEISGDTKVIEKVVVKE